MLSQRTNTNKAHVLICRHFCLPFDLHSYCPTCREVGDDPCVTGEKLCPVCSLFSEEQLCKIENRKRCSRKTKTEYEVDLLGYPDMGEIFLGSHEELEETAHQIYSSFPRTQHLGLETLSLETPLPVLEILGIVLQKKN